MSDYKLYSKEDFKQKRFHIIRNEFIPVHSQTLTKFDFSQSLPYLQTNVKFDVLTPEKSVDEDGKKKRGSSLGYSASASTFSAHDANRIFQDLINSDITYDKKSKVKINKPEFKVHKKIEDKKVDMRQLKERAKSNDAMRANVHYKFNLDDIITDKITEAYSTDCYKNIPKKVLHKSTDLPEFMKKKEHTVEYKDKLLLLLKRGNWKYLDTKNKQIVKEKYMKKNEAKSKVSNLAPMFMQPTKEENGFKKNYRDTERIKIFTSAKHNDEEEFRNINLGLKDQHEINLTKTVIKTYVPDRANPPNTYELVPNETEDLKADYYIDQLKDKFKGKLSKSEETIIKRNHSKILNAKENYEKVFNTKIYDTKNEAGYLKCSDYANARVKYEY